MRLGLYRIAAGEGAGPDGLASALVSAGAVLVDLGGRVQGRGKPKCDAVVVAGDEDDPEAGAVVQRSIDAFARAGGPVLAIGAGVRLLCGLDLLPGRVSAPLARERAPVMSHVRVEGRPTPFTSAIPAGRVLRWTAATALEWQLPDAAALEARGQVIFRACDGSGGTRAHGAIAGVSNQRGNVLGLLAPADIVAGDGEQLLRSLRLHLRAR